MATTAKGGPVDGALDAEALRQAIRDEYASVARNPKQGFHFHTGRPLAHLLGYDEAWLDSMPEGALASFAGTGNPFRLGALLPGEQVLDLGCGPGFERLIAARMVGAEGCGARGHGRGRRLPRLRDHLARGRL